MGKVRLLNLDVIGNNTYSSRIVAYLHDKASTLLWEETQAQLLWDVGNTMENHIMPRSWEKDK